MTRQIVPSRDEPGRRHGPGLSTRTPVTGQQVSPRRRVFALQRWRDCIALGLNWHPTFHRLFELRVCVLSLIASDKISDE
jgi:hypothetical protein